ncbi:hypothetical protein ES703_125428 [subsurface metagenome]
MKNYDKKVKQTRILLADYLVLKGIAQRTGQSMSEALHTIITRDWAMARSVKSVISAKIPVPVTSIRIPVSSPVAKAILGSTNVKLRATVAGKESSNGA